MKRLSWAARQRLLPCVQRHGFTLFEVLIALSLSLLLIGAVYSGLSLYWRFSSAGQADVERAQLARAILRRIELDVRSVMYRAVSTTDSQSAASGSSGSGSSSGSGGSSSGGTSSASNSSGSTGSGSSSSGSTDATTTPDDAYGTSSTGLFGNSTTLMMHVSRPEHEQMALALAASGNTMTRMSDLCTIAYFVSGASSGTLQQTTSGTGLARLEGDRLALAMADKQSGGAALASRAEILAPEVTAVRFMYYDGFQWRTDWDSSVLGGLPKAIDVELSLQPVIDSARTGRNTTSATAPTVYRLVIPIPLGKPIDTSTITTQ